MTRFQPQGPVPTYDTQYLISQQGEKPFKQIIGLYNMWQSLSPETRDKIASWFRSKGDVETDSLNPNFDTSLLYQSVPELGDESARRATIEQLVGDSIDWNSVQPVKNNNKLIAGLPKVGVDNSVFVPFDLPEDSVWHLK